MTGSYKEIRASTPFDVHTGLVSEIHFHDMSRIDILTLTINIGDMRVKYYLKKSEVSLLLKI